MAHRGRGIRAPTALEAVARVTDDHTGVIDEVVADKRSHSHQVLTDLAALDLRSYIAEPDRGRRHWTKQAMARTAVYANRRRIRGARGRAVLRRRSEYLERPNAHLYETGGLRRTHLRGHANILKRLLVHTGAFNLGLLIRTLIGVGPPRGLQGRLAAVLTRVVALWTPYGAKKRPRLGRCWSSLPSSLRLCRLRCSKRPVSPVRRNRDPRGTDRASPWRAGSTGGREGVAASRGACRAVAYGSTG